MLLQAWERDLVIERKGLLLSLRILCGEPEAQQWASGKRIVEVAGGTGQEAKCVLCGRILGTWWLPSKSRDLVT